jgi:hypothetical protein
MKSKALQIVKNKINTDTFRNIKQNEKNKVFRNTQSTTVHQHN